MVNGDANKRRRVKVTDNCEFKAHPVMSFLNPVAMESIKRQRLMPRTRASEPLPLSVYSANRAQAVRNVQIKQVKQAADAPK